MSSHVNFLKVGRLVRILRGPREDKVGVVTAIVDSNRCLVENPSDDKMWRHVQNLKNVAPTKFAVKLTPNAPTKQVAAALKEKDTLAKYAKTGASKKVQAKIALATSTDFERFQLRVAQRSRAHWSRKIFAAEDAKAKVSFQAKKAAKLEKVHKKFEGKKLKARHDRIKKHFTAVKAKKAAKGKGGKKSAKK